MKKISVLLAAGMLLMASVVYGQAEKTISHLVAGTTLNADDIGFLSMISNATLDLNRGATERVATIRKFRFAAGQTLTGFQADAIKAQLKTFQHTKSSIIRRRDRGAGYCYYWYYYCDYWGYCYWYRYWYYC